MKNTFEAEYQKELQIRADYDAAKEAGNEAGQEAARVDIHELWGSIEEKGAAYARIYRDYKDSRDRENTTVNFHDVIWDKDVKDLIDCMRANGIDRFTFSSGWSSSVETAWLFIQNGCKVEGMTQVNGNQNYFSVGYEQLPAYIFSIC